MSAWAKREINPDYDDLNRLTAFRIKAYSLIDMDWQWTKRVHA